MQDSKDLSCKDFIDVLGSKSSVPGGGGASALVGAIGMALGSMTGSLTLGKEKYKDVQPQIQKILTSAKELQDLLVDLIDEDAEAFEPLSKAYGLPASTEEEKAYKIAVMEERLHDACEVPLSIMRACCEAIKLHSELAKIGSKIAISDVGCGVVCCKAALRAASLNVFVNTRLMKDRPFAEACEDEANKMLEKYEALAEEAYSDVKERMK